MKQNINSIYGVICDPSYSGEGSADMLQQCLEAGIMPETISPGTAWELYRANEEQSRGCIG